MDWVGEGWLGHHRRMPCVSLWSCVCVCGQPAPQLLSFTQRWFVMLRPAALLFNLSRRHCANARLSLTTRSRPLRPATATTRFVACRSLSYTRPTHDAADTGNVTKAASIENGLTISDKAIKVCMCKHSSSRVYLGTHTSLFGIATEIYCRARQRPRHDVEDIGGFRRMPWLSKQDWNYTYPGRRWHVSND